MNFNELGITQHRHQRMTKMGTLTLADCFNSLSFEGGFGGSFALQATFRLWEALRSYIPHTPINAHIFPLSPVELFNFQRSVTRVDHFYAFHKLHPGLRTTGFNKDCWIHPKEHLVATYMAVTIRLTQYATLFQICQGKLMMKSNWLTWLLLQ